MRIIYLPLVEMSLCVILQTAGFPADADSNEVAGWAQLTPPQSSHSPALPKAATEQVQKAGRQKGEHSTMFIASKLYKIQGYD